MKLIIDCWCQHTEVEIGHLSYELDEKGEPCDIQVSVDKPGMDLLEEAGYLGNYREIDPWDFPRFGNKKYMVLIARLPKWRVEGVAHVIYTQEERL